MPWVKLTALDQQTIYVNTDHLDTMVWYERNGGYTALKRLAGADPAADLTVRETPEDIISRATSLPPESEDRARAQARRPRP